MHSTHFKIVSFALGCLVWAAAGFAQNGGAAKSKQPVATVTVSNAVATKSSQVVATVGGRSIYDEVLTPSIQGQLQRLRSQEYEVKKKALDSLIEDNLLEAEAKKKGIPKEKLLEEEINSKVQDPSGAELQAYYLALKDRHNRPLDEVKVEIKTGMKLAEIQKARQDYLKRLRADAEVVVLLSPPKVQVGFDPARSA